MHAIDPALASAAAAPGGAFGTDGKYGGCTPGYGRGKACLPPVSPAAVGMRMTAAQMPWTCPQVRSVLPHGIALNRPGIDPLRLDTNHDGTACGSGD